MLNLMDMKPGSSCSVTWITGFWAGVLRKKFDLNENDRVDVLDNAGNGGVIIAVHDRRLAISGDLACSVKVIPAV